MKASKLIDELSAITEEGGRHTWASKELRDVPAPEPSDDYVRVGLMNTIADALMQRHTTRDEVIKALARLSLEQLTQFARDLT